MHFFKKLILIFSRYIYQKLHKFSNFQNSLLYNIFHLYWIILIGSNHGKRFRSFKEEDENYEVIDWNIKKKAKNIFLFIGDSHAEFCGRNFKSNFSKDIQFLTVWLGPILLINFLKTKRLKKNFFFLINNLLKFFGKNKKYYLIFSFGEIDIRTSIYRSIYLNRVFKNEDDLFEYYNKNLNLVASYITKNIDEDYNVQFYFKEPSPQSRLAGSKPKTKFEMNNKYRNEKYPIFGDIDQRISWHKKLKKVLSISTKNFKFINNPKNFTDIDGLLLENISDGIHIISTNVLIDYQKKIMKFKDRRTRSRESDDI